jgi:hypothetical protein
MLCTKCVHVSPPSIQADKEPPPPGQSRRSSHSPFRAPAEMSQQNNKIRIHAYIVSCKGSPQRGQNVLSHFFLHTSEPVRMLRWSEIGLHSRLDLDCQMTSLYALKIRRILTVICCCHLWANLYRLYSLCKLTISRFEGL